jgi:hypothetical protein
MSELDQLREAWERADARLHAHLASKHRPHLPHEHQLRVSEMEAEIADDILGDPGEVEDAAEQARSTYDAYVAGLHHLGQGG